MIFVNKNRLHWFSLLLSSILLLIVLCSPFFAIIDDNSIGVMYYYTPIWFVNFIFILYLVIIKKEIKISYIITLSMNGFIIWFLVTTYIAYKHII